MDGFILFMLWITMALCIGVIAQKLNRSAILWSVLGFFFGIFALVILLILGNPQKDWRL